MLIRRQLGVAFTTLFVVAYANNVDDWAYDWQYDCATVVALFDSTCSGAGALSSMTSEAVSCSDVGVCGGTGDEFSCSHDRKLCATCPSASTIRIQSNSFPNHCYTAFITAPQATIIDFTVDFNDQVWETETVTIDGNPETVYKVVNNYEFNTQTDIDLALCNSGTSETLISPDRNFVRNDGDQNN